ncbi:DivIVA domain-containing protein [Glycomyces sp. NPDC046736]|uniref:caspase, EACC1-associated type n=1 Tax=Glycomyces sp. NPDC046736 TaxID=3155615 RepID=UPI0033F226FE
MRLPDGSKSRALLMGTAFYEHLDDVPQSGNNLRALQDALMVHTGLPRERCTRLLDPRDLTEVGAAVTSATAEAEELLLVYYSGHGLVDSYGKLHLALPQTSQSHAAWSGIPFETLHNELRYAPAQTKVLILDCCFSGIATDVLGDETGTLMGQIRVGGTFTLASSPANSPSYAPRGSAHTAFTGALLEVFAKGSESADEFLTLDDLYRELLNVTREQGLPEPQRCVTRTAEQLSLLRNRSRLVPSLADPSITPPPHEEQRPPLVTPEEINRVRFKTVRLAEGYDEEEVDAFLDEAVATLIALPGSQPLKPADVRDVQFTVTRLREGYDIDQVDAFLERIEATLEHRPS